MADDDRPRDPKLIQDLANNRRLDLRRAAVAAFAFAPTQASPIDQNDTMARR